MGMTADLWQLIGSAAWGTGAFACLIAAGLLYSRPGRFGAARRALVAAIGLTGLWALIGALAGPESLGAELADSLRNLAWLFALYRLFAIDGRDASLAPVRPLLVALCFVELLQLALEVAIVVSPFGGKFAELAFHTVTLFRLLVAIGGLV
ncbi:MAG: PEP-CTERM system histidine kinase PrsK, partial [Novosphingobium sp.]